MSRGEWKYGCDVLSDAVAIDTPMLMMFGDGRNLEEERKEISYSQYSSGWVERTVQTSCLSLCVLLDVVQSKSGTWKASAAFRSIEHQHQRSKGRGVHKNAEMCASFNGHFEAGGNKSRPALPEGSK